jgi:AcrR family transcriptional regulator
MNADLEQGQKAATARHEVGLANRSEEILRAAVQVFASKGFAATDVQEIADQAGVGKGTVYRHFGTKEGLFLAAADLGVQQLRSAIQSAADKVEHPLDRLRAAILEFLTFFDSHPEFVELVIQERAHFRDRQTPTFFDRKDDEATCRWRSELSGLIQQGVLRDLSVEQIMDMVGQFLFGAVFVNFFAGRNKSLARQCEEIADVIFHGILSSPTATPPANDSHA